MKNILKTSFLLTYYSAVSKANLLAKAVGASVGLQNATYDIKERTLSTACACSAYDDYSKPGTHI